MRTLKGYFDAADGRTLTVTVRTPGSGEGEISLADPPFETSVDAAETDMYEPVLGSGATLRIVTDSWLPELYAGDPTAVSVELSDAAGKTLWTGFADPCSYNQNWAEEFEVVELHCADGLSVLNNLKFADSMRSEELSFADIIRRCVAVPGCYKKVYVSDNVRLPGQAAGKNAAELMKVYDSCFFEAMDSERLTDRDRSWTAHDVLTETLRFMGYNAAAVGDSVVVFDRDAVRAGIDTYTEFSVGSAAPLGTVRLNGSFLCEGAIAAADAQIGLSEVYDSMRVKCEFADVDLDGETEGKERNITRADRTWMIESILPGRNSILFADGFGTDGADAFQCAAQRCWKDRRLATLWQFRNKPKYTTYNYANDSSRRLVTSLRDSCSFADMMTYNGAYLTRFHKGDVLEGLIGYNTGWADDRKLAYWNQLFGTTCKTAPLQDMIVMVNKKSEAGHIGPGKRIRTGSYGRIYPADLARDPEDAMSYPYLDYSDNSAFYFSGEQSYLIIHGEVLVHDEDDTPFPLSDGADNGKLKRDVDKKIKCEFYLHASLRVGDSWWNGEEWVGTKSFFRLFWQDECGKQGKDDTRQNQSFYDKWFKIRNMVSTNWNYTEEGYWVPAPPADAIGGTMTLTLYAPKDMWGQSNHNQWKEKNEWKDNRYNRYYSSVVCIRNFGVKAVVSDGGIDDRAAESDTVYCNVMEGPAVNEHEDITFKICTYDGKRVNRNSPVRNDLGTREFVEFLENRALASESGGGSRGDGLTAEENLILRVVRQYEEPRAVLDFEAEGTDFPPYWNYRDPILNKTYALDGWSTDWRRGTTKLKLIEKV